MKMKSTQNEFYCSYCGTKQKGVTRMAIYSFNCTNTELPFDEIILCTKHFKEFEDLTLHDFRKMMIHLRRN